ncbi:hypothetical protein BU23DRAFT_541578 [Bimuria novae-zelandiae CBS 107.79]|uniref:DUF3445 domain-containing protein n=1 Tax=Bimuria novae-zelandiae CBS 107.79 TaxID=1447943 RepID=A0A6A5UW77_9PLEO|nr:hypothetical protein BU23DRAFT_541578 [Bimuria novae-zelandiae CBS 107.79]
MTAEAFNREYFPKRYDNYRDLGLEKLDRQPRLTYDDEEQMIAREHIFEDFREACIQWRPGKEAEDACGELWMEVARYLCTQYPQRFRERKEKGTRKLLDHDTGEIYPLEGPFGWLTLDTITRLVREDFCIFKKSPFSAQHTLLAGAVCFPSGWRLRSRVGLSVDSQQEAVLSWESELLPEILAYMDENGDSDTYERNVTFVQTVRQEEPDFTKKYFIQECKDFFSGNVGTLFQPKTLHGRFERQMFTKLSKTGAIVLTTRVQVHPLAEIEEADLVAFAEDVRSWPAHVARLKGRDLWGSVVLNYIDEVTGRV